MYAWYILYTYLYGIGSLFMANNGPELSTIASMTIGPKVFAVNELTIIDRFV